MFCLCITTRNSRRLREASDRIDEEIAWFRKRISANDPEAMTLADCEGDRALFATMQASILQTIDWLTMRHKYLKLPPWRFSRADTQTGAEAFLSGVRSKPADQHDPLTRFLYDLHAHAIQEVANGGAATEELKAEVSAMNETPLDESAGEGYHRATHDAQKRASAAKTPYLTQAPRTKNNIRVLKRFLNMGEKGKAVVRFEWRNWKRVLQTRRRALYQNKRMKDRAVFERVYRMDEMAEVDWSSITKLVRGPGQGPPPAPLEPETASVRASDGLHIEYLVSVMSASSWYSVDVPATGLDAEGLSANTLQLSQ